MNIHKVEEAKLKMARKERAKLIWYVKIYRGLVKMNDTSITLIVLGGRSQERRILRSVEGYSFRENRWIELPEMNIPRAFHSAVVVGHLIIVSGGDVGLEITDTIEILNLDETPLQWTISGATLPVPLSGHQTVFHKGRLIAIGGYDENAGTTSSMIYEVQLTQPYTSRILDHLPQPRAGHGAELLNDRIFIFGGGRNPGVPSDDVLVYDILSNQFNGNPALPYQVQGMATVRGKKGVILVGGVNEAEEELSSVIEYDVDLGGTMELPEMMENRGGCCAAVDVPTNTLVVLGNLRELNSVEGYDFHHRVWNDMPPTIEAREFATMVASSNH